MRSRMAPPRRGSMVSMSSIQQERSDMPILTQDEARTILTKVLGYSKADECQVSLSGGDSANVRYARNSVSTSGAVSSTQLAVISTFGKKQGVTTINEYDDASLQKAVRRAETLAQLAPENPEHMPLLGPQKIGRASCRERV